MSDVVRERLGGLDPAAVETALRDAGAAADRETLPRFRTPLNVDNKWSVGFDPVTAADRGAESAISALLLERFPDHQIVGEEHGTRGESRFSWVIDPVDGTRSFIAGVPTWGTLIGLCVDGVAVAGLISQPFIGETALALPGWVDYRRGGSPVPLRTSGRAALAGARIATTTPMLFDRAGLRPQYDRLEAGALQARYGLDCYAFMLLAAGHIDLVIEAGLQPYDIVALLPIVREAGGATARIDAGRPEGGGHVIAAASQALLDEAMAIMRG